MSLLGFGKCCLLRKSGDRGGRIVGRTGSSRFWSLITCQTTFTDSFNHPGNGNKFVLLVFILQFRNLRLRKVKLAQDQTQSSSIGIWTWICLISKFLYSHISLPSFYWLLTMYRCDVTSVKKAGGRRSRNGQENLSINDSSDVFLIVFLLCSWQHTVKNTRDVCRHSYRPSN